MNSVVEDTLNKLKQCDDFHNRCDCLLEHSEITYLLEYIQEQEKENGILKHRLNDIIFDDANDDVELGARYLRKIGYVDFDEKRKVYLNKHNKEPFWQNDEREKNYYIKDEELDEYTKQLEYKMERLDNIIDKAIDKIQYIIDYGFDYDGFNNIEDLKGLIDMLVQYAVEGRNILKGEDKE